MKYRPSGGSTGAGSIRRHVSLREPHLRLCTFASPRRVPSGHGVRWAWRPPGTNPDRENHNRRLRRFAQILLEGMSGCDPYGVVEGVGDVSYPGSATPGYGMGMLRIPQICRIFTGCNENTLEKSR